jgi:hypothetical protein
MLAVLIGLASFVTLAVAGRRFGVDSRSSFGDRPGRCLDC